MPDKNNIKNIVDKIAVESIADYFSADKKIEQAKKNIPDGKRFKIAIFSSFTAKGVKEVLNVECFKLGIIPEFFVSDYKQYAQDILDKNSSFYSFKSDLAIVFIDTRSLLGENFFLPYQISDAKRKKDIEEKFVELKSLAQTILKRTSARIIFHNFETPLYSPLGILENKQKFGFCQAIEELNFKLRELFKNNSRVFLFDYNSFSSKIGKNRLSDPKMYYLADIKVNLEYLPVLAREYLSYIKAMLSLSRKCLVLDLDNTLWGGIVGEDGIEGIKLGPTPEGRPFLEFQKYILSLFNRGIILAINSSNNQNDVSKVLKEHPYMILKEKHFAAMQINWNNKISNMREIQKQLNIGLDSMVFIDDSKVNREMIKEAIPEVLVVDLPQDPSLYARSLMEINDFNTIGLTKEDKKRGRMYASQREREKFKEVATDIESYLKNLNTVVTFKKADSFTIPRIAQLTQKTNQFNMTTRRYIEEDIEKFLKSNDYLVISAKVEDKFGDNGIAAAAVVEKTPEIAKKQWRIDTFLLSCRVIGRAIEKVMLNYIIEQAKKEGAEMLVGEFIATSKNDPAKDFYKNNGFNLAEEEKDFQKWHFAIGKKQAEYPEFIKVLKD